MLRRSLAAFVVALAVPLAALAGSVGSMSGGTVNHPGYSTIVVFGDSQKAMQGYQISGPSADRYAEMDAVIDWIFANQEKENIAFVLHVGDAIQSGVSLPPDGTQCDFENGPPYTVDEGSNVCFDLTVAGEAACESETGCFWTTEDGDAPGCASCLATERAGTEWTGFQLLWDRFLPGGDTADGIPAFLVDGNHDNAGTQNAIDTDREPLGYNDRFSTAYWDALDGDYGPRAYEHVASFSDSVTGNAHQWLAELGTQPVVIVSIPCCILGEGGIDDDVETWAVGVLDDYPTTPAIVLTHHANSIESIVIDSGDAPNVFAYVGGHDGNRLQTIRTAGGRQVLRSETDWTNASGTQSDDYDTNGIVRSDYATIVRIWPNDEIEAFGWSTEGNARHSAAANAVPKQSLDVVP